MATPRLITAAEAALDDLGDVKGPGPVTDGNIALFDGTTGTLLKAAGVVEGVATIDATTNILIGDGAGNAIDSTVPISALGGSFIASNTVRVDALGSDETGAFGDLTKPFLTVAAAIAAIEALDPIPDFPVIDIGNNNFNTENLTTALKSLVIVGSNQGNPNNTPFASLTFTEESDDVVFVLKDCDALENTSANVAATPGTDGVFKVHLINANLGDVFNSLNTSQGGIVINGYGGSKVGSVGLFSTNAADEIRNITELDQIACADGSQPIVYNCIVQSISLGSGTASINADLSCVFNPSGIASGVTIYLPSAPVGLNFPDGDPLVAGAPYWDGATLKKSAGP